MNRQTIKDIGEALSIVSIIVGFGVTTCSLRHANVLEQEHNVEIAYDSLAHEYAEFEKLCLQYVKLDCADNIDPDPAALTKEEATQQRLVYSVWLTMMEHFVRYVDTHGFDGNTDQLDGWIRYGDDYLRRKALVDYWEDGRDEYSASFQCMMETRLKLLGHANADRSMCKDRSQWMTPKPSHG